jgi:hypothetical protein
MASIQKVVSEFGQMHNFLVICQLSMLAKCNREIHRQNNHIGIPGVIQKVDFAPEYCADISDNLSMDSVCFFSIHIATFLC